MRDHQQTVIFPVKPGPVRAAWIGPVFFVGVAAWVAFMIARFDGDLGPNPPAVFTAAFYGFLSLGVIVPLLRAWSLWRRLPAHVSRGRLVLDEEGILFDMGESPVRIGWQQIAAVHPVTHRPTKPPSALFLPDRPRGPLGAREQSGVLKRIGGRWARIMPHEDGVIVPILLLGLDEARTIETEMRARLPVHRGAGA